MVFLIVVSFILVYHIAYDILFDLEIKIRLSFTTCVNVCVHWLYVFLWYYYLAPVSTIFIFYTTIHLILYIYISFNSFYFVFNVLLPYFLICATLKGLYSIFIFFLYIFWFNLRAHVAISYGTQIIVFSMILVVEAYTRSDYRWKKVI